LLEERAHARGRLVPLFIPNLPVDARLVEFYNPWSRKNPLKTLDSYITERCKGILVVSDLQLF
jgi:hypothetical protein